MQRLVFDLAKTNVNEGCNDALPKIRISATRNYSVIYKWADVNKEKMKIACRNELQAHRHQQQTVCSLSTVDSAHRRGSDTLSNIGPTSVNPRLNSGSPTSELNLMPPQNQPSICVNNVTAKNILTMRNSASTEIVTRPVTFEHLMSLTQETETLAEPAKSDQHNSLCVTAAILNLTENVINANVRGSSLNSTDIDDDNQSTLTQERNSARDSSGADGIYAKDKEKFSSNYDTDKKQDGSENALCTQHSALPYTKEATPLRRTMPSRAAKSKSSLERTTLHTIIKPARQRKLPTKIRCHTTHLSASQIKKLYSKQSKLTNFHVTNLETIFEEPQPVASRKSNKTRSVVPDPNGGTVANGLQNGITDLDDSGHMRFMSAKKSKRMLTCSDGSNVTKAHIKLRRAKIKKLFGRRTPLKKIPFDTFLKSLTTDARDDDTTNEIAVVSTKIEPTDFHGNAKHLKSPNCTLTVTGSTKTAGDSYLPDNKQTENSYGLRVDHHASGHKNYETFSPRCTAVDLLRSATLKLCSVAGAMDADVGDSSRVIASTSNITYNGSSGLKPED